MDYFLFAFDSTTGAIGAQKLLAGLDAVVMPTLREITAGCGISLRLSPNRAEDAMKLLSASEITGWQLYSVQRENERILCKPVCKKI